MEFKFENGIIDIRIKTKGGDPRGYEWVSAILEVTTQSGYRAIQQLSIYVFDLEYLYKCLESLKRGNIDSFTFAMLEHDLILEAKLHMTGNVKWTGIVQSHRDGTKLNFYFDSDNASILHFADEVWKTLQEYPVAKKRL